MTNARDENKVYFVGAGPGSPGYLTADGSRALASCTTVYALDPYPETFSGILAGKEVHDPFERVFNQLVSEVDAALTDGSVCFLVPGDLTVFSPFIPLVEHFGRRARVIAGVGVVNAAAALLQRTLDMPGVSHTVVLTSPKHIDKAGHQGELARLAAVGGTMVLYMNNRPLDDLAAELMEGYRPETPVAVVCRVGMDGEKIYRGTLANIAGAVGDDDVFGLDSGHPSMGIILVGDVLAADSDPAFWNKRKRKFWDREEERK